MTSIRQLRVLLITESSVSGGAARYVRELTAALNAGGHQATVLANKALIDSHHQQLRRSLRERMLFPLELIAEYTDFRHFASRRELAAIPESAFDVVHLNQISGAWLSMCAVQGLTRRFPTVWTHHDEWAATEGISCLLEGKVTRSAVLRHASAGHRILRLSPYHSSFKSRSVGRLLDRYCPRVDLHISPSEHLRSKLLAHPRHRNATVRVIRNATSLLDSPETRIERQEARRRLAIPLDAELVLMVSVNLGDIHKGLSHGLSVVRRLASDHSRLQTILLGRANAAIASATDGIRCTTHEAMTPGELALYYRAADVTLIPSLADNFPYVAIESLACGTPFVAFSEGGPKEIADLERNGLLAPCFDEGQLAECVRRVLTDSRLRDSLGTSGLAWVRQHCSPDVMVKDVQQAYSDAINIFYGHSQTHTSRIKPSGQ